MKKSVWTDTINLPEFKKIENDIKTDVLIIGGGLCGILCAYYLKKAGVDYVLCEAKTICSGITKNTTAKITSQHGLIYSKLIKDFGLETAQMYLDINQKALLEYEKLSREISCNLEKKSAYTYSMTDEEKILDEVDAVNKLGFSAKFIKEPNLPFKTKGAICFENQAQFHPLEFVEKIAYDLNIYENSPISDITPAYAMCEKFKIYAKKIIVATHFPFINMYGAYFLKLYQHRSYVLAVEGADNIEGMYVDEDKKGMSFRTYKNLLLIGGAGHRTGKSSYGWRELTDFTKKYYPNAKIKYQWAAQDCMTLDSIPYIGQYSKRTPDLFVACGFNKWGITSSMVSAMILCDIVLEKENDYAKIFSPQRSIIKPQLFVNGFKASVNLLSPTTKRCPHMGCALKWNKQEHTWDCPCHGSRFEENGKLIDNPAKKDLKINED